MKVRDPGGPNRVGAPTEPAPKGSAPKPTLGAPDSVRLATRGDASAATRRANNPLAARLAAARERETELSTLQATLADPRRPAEVRGKAGVAAALLLVQRNLRPDAGEAALNQALALAPALAESPDAQRARVMIRLGRGDAMGAQAILRPLLAAAPEDPELMVLAAEARRQEGDPAGALGLLAEARALVDAEKSPGVAARLAFTAAYASFAAGRPQDTLRYGREAFALGVGPARDTRVASKASQLLRELMCPDFEAPHRAEVEAGLERATAAFQRGDWDAVQLEAQAILQKEPDEALAFHLFAVSEQRRVDDRPLIAALATPEQRAALIAKLEAELAAAGTTPQRAVPGLGRAQRDAAGQGRPQRAVVRRAPARHARGPPRSEHPPGAAGESCTSRDPDTARTAKHDAFGRHWYGTRGWVGRRDVVIGLEDVEAAARGGYDTVTHELGHLAHAALERRGFEGAGPNTRIALMRQGLGPDQLRSFGEALTRRFDEARAGGAARPVTDYAGTCVEEYVAESLMAAANPIPSPGPCQERLQARDPKMAALAEAIFADISRLP
ncbi:MAG: hypothetical protein H6730_30345 [Deltaproteobacteria bacterium]|nr:hypothetical protein [Deltaproteobacteria bacterium]